MGDDTDGGGGGGAGDLATRAAIEAVWRLESTRLIAALVRIVRDVGLAEDLAQEAVVAALAQWPSSGIPNNPGAWLMTTAKRRAVDTFRRRARQDAAVAALAHELSESVDEDPAAGIDHVEDDVLRLMFICCHPALTTEAQTTLTLKLVAGLSTREIARAFLSPEATVAQRISRAKKALSEAAAEFELPVGAERAARLDDVMAVIYLVFNEGYTATLGEDWMRPEMANEAIRLARMLAELMPDEPEVHGLQALLELQVSRGAARLDADGRPVLLEDQDRGLWDELLIRRGLAALARAERLAARGLPVGRYYLQAAIASHHARAATAEETDWRGIAHLYDVLAEAAPGPVVEVNRAVAHGRAYGSAAGLAVLDGLAAGALTGSHLLASVRADLLARAGRHAEAAASFREAAALTRNESERELLLGRAEEAGRAASGHP